MTLKNTEASLNQVGISQKWFFSTNSKKAISFVVVVKKAISNAEKLFNLLQSKLNSS